MAAPNIVNVTTIYGKTNGVELTTSSATILENAAASGLSLRVNSLYIGNKSASPVEVTVTYAKGAGDQRVLCFEIPVPVGGTLVVITKDAPLTLEEEDILEGVAGESDALDVVFSYDEISAA